MVNSNTDMRMFRNKLEPTTRMEEGFIEDYGPAIIRAARGSWRPGDKDPTFQEFISYLLQTPVEQYDWHWKPIALICRLGDCENISEHENTLIRYVQENNCGISGCVRSHINTSCGTRV